MKTSFFSIMCFIAVTLSALNTNASANNLFYQNGGQFYGSVSVFPGSHFRIVVRDGTEIKTYANSGRSVNSNGVAGVRCTWAQFKNGRVAYSGEGMFFQNGLVYLRWLHELNGISSRPIDSGWILFRP